MSNRSSLPSVPLINQTPETRSFNIAVKQAVEQLLGVSRNTLNAAITKSAVAGLPTATATITTLSSTGAVVPIVTGTLVPDTNDYRRLRNDMNKLLADLNQLQDKYNVLLKQLKGS